ncbi:MAG: DUF6448 family protein [Myxococcaceae bacterium]
MFTVQVLLPLSLSVAPFLLLALGVVLVHSASVEGPVVRIAREALERNDVRPILTLVAKLDEPEIKAAFESSVAVRALGPEPKRLADAWFLEKVVRLHRAGEPFSGLRPATHDLGPAVGVVDRALAAGNAEPVLTLLTRELQDGVRERLRKALALKSYPKDDIDAGRRFVSEYGQLLNYVDRLHQAATRPDSTEEDKPPRLV